MKLDNEITLATREERTAYCKRVLSKLSRVHQGEVSASDLMFMAMVGVEESLYEKLFKRPWEPKKRTILRLHQIDNAVFKPLGL